MTKIAPSILSADFTRLGAEIRAAEDAGAHMLHIDIMDGHFVPNITIGPLVVKAVRKVTALPLDVHLMISDPDLYVGALWGPGPIWSRSTPRPCATFTDRFNSSGRHGPSLPFP